MIEDESYRAALDALASEVANWTDLRARLERAHEVLIGEAASCNPGAERARLRGKAAGVALALDYMRGYA